MVMIFKDTECLLFDMDGVILDNTYDNNFWQNQIPDKYPLRMPKGSRYKYLITKKILKIGTT